MTIANPDVAIRQGTGSTYPSRPPYDPHLSYPDYPFTETEDREVNEVYDLVRASLIDLRLDRDNLGTARWSPFGELIRPGDTVAIKPNLVLDTPIQDIVTTHASVIRPLIDYAWKALRGKGSIVVCDAPMANANFEAITRDGLAPTIDLLARRGVNVRLEDLRALKVVAKNDVWVAEQDVPSARQEAVVIDLEDSSAFAAYEDSKRILRGGGYGVIHPQDGKHEYCVSKTLLDADVVISAPKFKAHKKAGITCCLKNLVGINVDKDYLPHFSIGPTNSSGDEFPRIAPGRLPLLYAACAARDFFLGTHWRVCGRWIAALTGIVGRVCRRRNPEAKERDGSDGADTVFRLLTGVECRQGAWQGNDTIWRMILDLNRLFLYARSDGSLGKTVQRKVFYAVDAYLSGDGDGPMSPTKVESRVVACGFNAVMVDLALLGVAGINPKMIPLYREVKKPEYSHLHWNESPSLILNGKAARYDKCEPLFSFHPPKNWRYS